MARRMTATYEQARGTFLLEMALDQARLRERIGQALHRERERRGGGDARRFPQPEMARLLDLSLRQYQRIESGQSMPRWRNLEDIAERLDLELDDLIGEPEASTQLAPDDPQTDLRALASLLEQVLDVVNEIAARQSVLARRLDALDEPEPAQRADG